MTNLVRMHFGSHVYGTNVATSNQLRVYGYVYITRNLVNGKQYIGMKKLRNTRGRIDECYLGSGKSFRAAVKKHGRDNFAKEVVYVSFDEIDLSQAEKGMIATFNAVNDAAFYNMAHGGRGVTLRGKQHPRFGKPIPEGHRKALATASRFSGCKHTEDAKKRIRAKNSGEGNFFFGKKHTEETKSIISAKAKQRLLDGHPMLGRSHSPESIKQNVASQPHLVSVEFEGVRYTSLNEVRKKLGFSHCKIRRLIRDGLAQVADKAA